MARLGIVEPLVMLLIYGIPIAALCWLVRSFKEIHTSHAIIIQKLDAIERKISAK